MNPRIVKLTVLVVACAILAGCGARRAKKEVLATDQSQVEQRSYQTRAFDTTDTEQMLRAVIATLQDFGFIIDRADAALGVVSGTKLDRPRVRITVTVRPRGTTQLLVRANAEYQIKGVTDAKPYQNFFTALERSMFLKAHEVD
jgi:cell division protein FtsB